MTAHSNSGDSTKQNRSADIYWKKLYLLLRPLVKIWVYSANVSSWKGQEDDIVEDIVQEALLRLLKYSQRAEKGEVTPVNAVEHMLTVIAHNYCRDLKRREQRLVRPSLDEGTYQEPTDSTCTLDPSEIVLNKVYQEWLFERLCLYIITFPDKQKKALLIDLARHTHFSTQPTLLQQAFSKQQIRLQDYQQSLPENTVERSRYAALLSLAYKRVSKLAYM